VGGEIGIALYNAIIEVGGAKNKMINPKSETLNNFK